MEFITKSKILRESSLKRWVLKRVNILEQARLESSRHSSRFSFLFPIDDGNGDVIRFSCLTLHTSSELTRQGASGCLSSSSRSPDSVHLNSSGWIHQARYMRSEDFPSCADLIPSPLAISNKLLSLLTLLLLFYWCLFTLDIGGLFVEPIQEKKLPAYS